MKSSYETVDRIRRSHRHAQPNPAENPAWANCHMDCGVLLDYITELENTTILRDQIDDLMSQVSRLSARKAQLEAALAKEKGGWDAFYKLRRSVGEERYPGMTGEVTAQETKGNEALEATRTDDSAQPATYGASVAVPAGPRRTGGIIPETKAQVGCVGCVDEIPVAQVGDVIFHMPSSGGAFRCSKSKTKGEQDGL